MNIVMQIKYNSDISILTFHFLSYEVYNISIKWIIYILLHLFGPYDKVKRGL